jgi:DNA-directed RNA polymerase specialized sigma24 family protein
MATKLSDLTASELAGLARSAVLRALTSYGFQRTQPADLDDLSQDLICRIVANAKATDGDSTGLLWLRAQSVVVDWRRKLSRQPQLASESDLSSAPQRDTMLDVTDELPDWIVERVNRFATNRIHAMQLIGVAYYLSLGMSQRDVARELPASLRCSSVWSVNQRVQELRMILS